MFINGLRMNGAVVTECHEPFWEIFEEKDAGFGFHFSTILQFLRCQLKLAWKYATKIPDHDVVIVGFIGQPDMFLAKLLTWLTGRKLVVNPLVSIFDTVVGDRQFVHQTSVKARFFKWLDGVSCKLADLVFLDTQAHIAYFCGEFGINPNRFKRIWVGADEHVFKPLESTGQHSKAFKILFVGKFIPLHGIPKIVETAQLLESSPYIQFTLIGKGQLHQEIEAQITALGLKNVDLIDWVPYEELSRVMSESDLILGIFGDSEKAKRVIPNKVYQALAVGKPVLTMDSVASRELLVRDENAFLVENTPEAMAEMIRYLKEHKEKCNAVGAAGYQLFMEQLNTSVIGNDVLHAIQVRVID
ncbi:MAG: glycosyltransferase [Candidatus Marinimicrobia bacterium]|nr:glycosyltransferase [Candidatus Neomarinimicrobiota bacterium]MCF7902491.1 glycosyltransferase [Candidatus Neomarinimicrobiota bacterium]